MKANLFDLSSHPPTQRWLSVNTYASKITKPVLATFCITYELVSLCRKGQEEPILSAAVEFGIGEISCFGKVVPAGSISISCSVVIHYLSSLYPISGFAIDGTFYYLSCHCHRGAQTNRETQKHMKERVECFVEKPLCVHTKRLVLGCDK